MHANQIERLFIYPIKSMGAVEVDRLRIGTAGVLDDRRYMLVNQKGRFITQRSHSCLSQFQLSATDQGWQVTGRDGSSIVIEDAASGERLINTKVWSDALQAREKSPRVSEWFSQQLDEIVYLVEMDDLEHRVCQFNGHQTSFHFADGFPLLVANLSSLNVLNEKLDTTIEMLRFRPNIVIDLPPQSEYELTGIQLENGGELLFTKACERCNIPAIDQVTSVFQRNIHEQLKFHLNRDNKVIFGMNAIPIKTTEILKGQGYSYSLD